MNGWASKMTAQQQQVQNAIRPTSFTSYFWTLFVYNGPCELFGK